ncbi:hypothetical protein HMPREF9332_00342 [Alloprevotella rava F0323]|uniref:Uncharacterized protein n=1 Tax=Alloprevotella rava F0323 TaxID=679199 RepID=G5G9U1_9BACT|nr:hypothetical protein [Alloprevotella rava]EHG24141.1 hypothetical protein HMPREF9332_00342 [Alloprevotella rava F0323]
MKRIFLGFIAMLMAVAMQAKDDGRIYVFGISTSFNDSIVYISAVQDLQGASLQKKTGFLEYRSSYTAEFQQYLESKYQSNQTCAIFFATDRNKLEKKYLKLRKRINKEHPGTLKEISASDFQFSVPVFQKTEE